MRFHLALFLVTAAGVIQLASAQDSCPFAYGPDGSFYDLSSIANKVFTLTEVYGGQTFHYNISICSSTIDPCSNSCPTVYSAGVCQFWGKSPSSRVCFGNVGTRKVIGLAGGAGVQIFYNSCGSCNPPQPRSSVITLTCDPNNKPWDLIVTDVYNAPQSSVLFINATIGCVQKSPPVFSPRPSFTLSSAPSIFNPNKHVTIQYYGYDPSCNGSDAFMVTVTSTSNCKPGCQKIGSKYIKTDCDADIIHLPTGATWVEQLTYNDSCDTPQSAVYTRSHTCTGNRVWTYQECDADFVWTYDCGSTYCQKCTMVDKSATEICANGSMYKCVASSTKNKHRNPLL